MPMDFEMPNVRKFRAPQVPWLYSGVTKTKASNVAIFAAHALVCGLEYLP